MTILRPIRFTLALALASAALAAGAFGAEAMTWKVSEHGDELRISYGSGAHYPQYAALHRNDSYFRLTPTPTSGWGTSVVLMPPLRTNGQYLQGAPVDCNWAIRDSDLVLTLVGSVSTLNVTTVVRLHPPGDGFLVADVASSTSGDVQLDVTPGETFKPMMFSSMHESATIWDSRSAYTDHGAHSLPLSGWILSAPVMTGRLGLRGGDSSWKPGAPTLEVNLLSPSALAVTGWVTPSQDPNDDNVALWANSDSLLSDWSYQLVAKTDSQSELTPPAFRLSPRTSTLSPDSAVAFVASAIGTPSPTLSWELSRDGGDAWLPLSEDNIYSGTHSDTLRLSSAPLSFDGHRYRCVATNPAGTAASAAALLNVGTGQSHLSNLSARAHCGNADRVTVGGLVIAGEGSKQVLVRAVGPTLARQGLNSNDVLSDPTLAVHHHGMIIAQNDHWTENPHRDEVTALAAKLGASPLASDDRTSSVLLLTLNAGVYTFVVQGKSSASGIVLLEIYDADPANRNARFTNLSTRADCGAGDSIAISGLVVGGTGAKHVLLRALGPTLANYGITESLLLADPMIELHRGPTVIGANDDCADGVDAAVVQSIGARTGAAPLAASDRQSSALLLSLPAGPCTFHVTGKDGTSGIVLVEIYDAD